jgi:hypothetical protein
MLPHPSDQRDPRSWYAGSKWWRRTSANQLKLEPLCAECLKNSVITPAVLAHHVQPVKGQDGRASWMNFRMPPKGLASYCLACHQKLHAEQKGASRQDDVGQDGWPKTDANHPAVQAQKRYREQRQRALLRASSPRKRA